MKRIALFASVLTLLSGSAFAQNIPVDAKVLETLQARIAALESRVRDLESTGPEKAKETPTAQVETKSQSPAPAPAPPKAASPAPGRPYTIQEGDTVSEIARKHGIPRTAFMEANNIREGEQIYIGDQVIIPSPPGSSSRNGSGTQVAKRSSAGSQTTYTIKYGDTLSSIARKHNVSVDAIKAANKMDTDQISGGQKLIIPGKSASGTVASNTGTSPKTDAKNAAPAEKTELLRQEESYGLYTVEKGDTLFSLARDFFTSQEELQRLNEMGNSIVLRPGKDMVVPTSKYFEHHKLAGN